MSSAYDNYNIIIYSATSVEDTYMIAYMPCRATLGDCSQD